MKCALGLIAVGSNLPGEAGNSLSVCNFTIDRFDSADLKVVRRARWRRTPAYPAGAGPDFVNGAVMVETTLSASSLLVRLHEIEAEMGRIRRERWGPRVCDLDLIAYDDVIAPDRDTVIAMMRAAAQPGIAEAPDEMILPHPRMQERAFVLAPLADIAPEWRHPITGQRVSDMLAALPDAARAEVTIIGADER